MSDRGKARKVQKATGMSYQTCLRLVRGEAVFTSASEDCQVQKALLEATKGHYVQPEGPKKTPCWCEVCDP